MTPDIVLTHLCTVYCSSNLTDMGPDESVDGAVFKSVCAHLSGIWSVCGQCRAIMLFLCYCFFVVCIPSCTDDMFLYFVFLTCHTTSRE